MKGLVAAIAGLAGLAAGFAAGFAAGACRGGAADPRAPCPPGAPAGDRPALAAAPSAPSREAKAPPLVEAPPTTAGSPRPAATGGRAGEPTEATTPAVRGAHAEVENDLAGSAAVAPEASTPAPARYDPDVARADALLDAWLTFDPDPRADAGRRAEAAARAVREERLRDLADFRARLLDLLRERRRKIDEAETRLEGRPDEVLEARRRALREFADSVRSEAVRWAPAEVVDAWLRAQRIVPAAEGPR